MSNIIKAANSGNNGPNPNKLGRMESMIYNDPNVFQYMEKNTAKGQGGKNNGPQTLQ